MQFPTLFFIIVFGVNEKNASYFMKKVTFRGYLGPLPPSPSLKIGIANAIYWKSLGLFRDYGLNHFF